MSLETIYDAILNGDAKKAAAEVAAALDAKIPPEEILHKACIPAMGEVGRLFEAGEKFVPEMLISARAMQAGMNLLRYKVSSDAYLSQKAARNIISDHLASSEG